jgi:hypothetical protein
MKIRKTVSEKVIRANRTNAQESTGPGDCTNVKHNAIKHGFRSKQLIFQNAEEEQRYAALLEELEEYHQPDGPIEGMLIEEIGRCHWRLEDLNGWALQEITNRRQASQAILRGVAENYDEERLPLFTTASGSDSAAQLGWDCEQLIVRTGSKNFEREELRSRMEKMSKTDKSGAVQIEVKLNTSMDSILRYEAALKRDLYRAIRTLLEIQRQRLGE